MRFEILEDGPGRFVVVDNENDSPAPVFRTCREAERAIEDAGMVEYGLTLKRRMSWVWHLLGFDRSFG